MNRVAISTDYDGARIDEIRGATAWAFCTGTFFSRISLKKSVEGKMLSLSNSFPFDFSATLSPAIFKLIQ